MTRSERTTVAERLRSALDVELADLREGVDMSAAAVTSRIRELCEMSTLCLMLASRPSEDAQRGASDGLPRRSTR